MLALILALQPGLVCLPFLGSVPKDEWCGLTLADHIRRACHVGRDLGAEWSTYHQRSGWHWLVSFFALRSFFLSCTDSAGGHTAGVRAQMGTWKQNGAVTALATNTSQAIKLAGMGVWEQWGPINISLAQRAIGTLLHPWNPPAVNHSCCEQECLPLWTNATPGGK